MKIFCKAKQHWEVNNGKLFLDADTDGHFQNQWMLIMARLEAEIRLDIYEQICAVDFTNNRKLIVKSGIENVALQVQDICAQIAIGETK